MYILNFSNTVPGYDGLNIVKPGIWYTNQHAQYQYQCMQIHILLTSLLMILYNP